MVLGGVGSLRCVFNGTLRGAGEVGENPVACFLAGGSRRDSSSERLQKHDNFLRKERW